MINQMKLSTAGLVLAAALAAAACSPNTAAPVVPGASTAPSPGTAATAAPSAMPTTVASASPTPTPAANAKAQVFVADLQGSTQVPPVTTAPGAGGFSVAMISPDDKTMKFWTWVTGLSGAPTAAHAHRGKPTEAGPVLKGFDLASDLFSETATWTTTDATAALTPANIVDFKGNNTYANVHTAKYPDGEIRGQYGAAGEVYAAVLTGAEETPALATTARGVSWLTVSANRQSVNVKIYTSGLSGDITSAHLHQGAAGVAGDAVKMLSVTGDKRGVTGEWVVGDGAGDMTPARYNDLEAGNLYVNVHTTANPNGEIRGQLILVK